MVARFIPPLCPILARLTDFTLFRETTMGLNNFTGHDDDDDDDTNGSGTGPGVPGGQFVPFGGSGPLTGQPSDDDELAKSLLINYNERFVNASPVMFRDQSIEQLLSVLISKNKPNALLVGAAGVGKTKIVEDLARRIALGDMLIPAQLSKATIYELPIASLVAGSSMVGMLEEKVQAVVKFASNPANDAVLFMDEIHQLVGKNSGGESIYGKIAQILKPALARGDMRVIGATTSQESRNLDHDPAFNRRFTRLTVDELTPEQTVAVLRSIRPGLMTHYRNQITVSDDVLEFVVQTADTKSRAGQHRPDNAITLLDRAMSNRVLEHRRQIREAEAAGDHVILAALQATPMMPLTQHRVEKVATHLLTGFATNHSLDVEMLRARLHAELLGQDDVLDQMVDALARHELGLFPRRTPLAWMLAGASGVGKTQAAKIIAEELTNQPPIILNMTEYHHSSAIQRIIGAPPGYIGSDSNAELPFDSLESNPHRVILLDEFEKCDPAVQRLFLSALDEGYITTSQNKQLDFSKAVVIATTNAAREALSGSSLGFASRPSAPSHQSLNKMLANYFDAELLGRFTMVLGFNPLDEAMFANIVLVEFASQRARIVAEKPSLTQSLPMSLNDDHLAVLVKNHFVPSQGARPAAIAVRKYLEDAVLQQSSGPQTGSVLSPMAATPADGAQQSH